MPAPQALASPPFSHFDFAENSFNADDRAAELNAGSWQSIPLTVREAVNREFEEFVHRNIALGRSFALETTLRSTITFEQARLAREKGFRVFMRYVALDTVARHIERVKRRAARGGHAASETTLRRIHASSLANFACSLDPQKSGIDGVRVYDNSATESRPMLVLAARDGKVIRVGDSFPDWLLRSLGWTQPDVDIHREKIRQIG